MPDSDAAVTNENIAPTVGEGGALCQKCKKRPIEAPYVKCGDCRRVDRDSKKRKKERDAAVRMENDARAAKRAKPAPVRDDPELDNEEQSDVYASSSEDENSATYKSHQDLFSALRKQAHHAAEMKTSLDFTGNFSMPVNEHESDKERVQLTSRDVWKMTGYRFTVHDHWALKRGHRTRFFCSQDESSKKVSKPSQNPDAKWCETPGVTRFISINLRHTVPHVAYYDVSLPTEAADMIRDNIEWCTPSELSEVFWKCDKAQLPSAAKLLTEFPDEVDIFTPENVPEDVQILCWGMKKIVTRLTARIVEIAIDATYGTNTGSLELYGVLAEHNNAGFPLSYCLLSTASSVSIGKRKRALTAYGECLRDTYNIDAKFAHTDKDLAEIAMLKAVWNCKISQCWWHVSDAMGKHLKKAKLSTTPYNSMRAHTEFSFIDVAFVPPGKSDPTEFEGGILELNESSEETANPSRLTFVLPPSQHPSAPSAPVPPRLDASGIPLLRIPPLPRANGGDVEMEGDDGDEETESSRRQFCAAEKREPIMKMMKPHAFAHPLIPGYCHPSKEGIRYWAVKEMYDYCVEHDLREAWAYMWENWYRPGRWELWVHSAHPTIPRLRTTMICESHWRRIKRDFLHHLHTPRVDFLVWILITKLAPTYYCKLDNLFIDTGRYRELMSWRKTFKAEWRSAETRPVNKSREEDVYRPDPVRWVCTCPAFLVNRFLICKHLVQSVHRVPTRFFQQAKRNRTTPFWKHPDLVPLIMQANEQEPQTAPQQDSDGAGEGGGQAGDAQDNEDDDLIESDVTWLTRAATFDE
ncbi:hypothetical protein GGX14DRAFT_567335 [Mycena pura]|uniref:SWIM-type domain-containing protein n=1 Tax=Mycena pura TaxID=153505 RepID=A0AAD6VBQ9_9AGAR|nr:hypothetical protein GGX14DRAFT_567335 [Mycena pura]